MKRNYRRHIESPIRLPRHVEATIDKLESTRGRLSQELGREPTDEEVGERLGLAASKVGRLRLLRREPLSLSDGADGAGPGDIEDENAVSPFDALVDSELASRVRSVLAGLAPRERRVLLLRFGFDGGAEPTYEEVGRALGLTAGRIRQIQAKALRKLRHPRFASRLRAYLST